MVEARFTHSAQNSEEPVELFEYIEQEISEDITRQDTPMREADTPNRRLAITLYYLASTSEYRTTANAFGVTTRLHVLVSRTCVTL